MKVVKTSFEYWHARCTNHSIVVRCGAKQAGLYCGYGACTRCGYFHGHRRPTGSLITQEGGTFMQRPSLIPDTELPHSLVEFLLDPFTHSKTSQQVELIETHISWVFLTEHYAYKCKKPVKFEFLDFSTPEMRRRACEDELRLNRRLAPTVYLDVVPIRRDCQGRLSLDGQGEPIEWLVKMERLRADRTLESLIMTRQIRTLEIVKLARKLTDFYLQAEPVAIDFAAYRQALERHVRANQQSLSEQGLSESPRATVAMHVKRVHSAQLRYLKLSSQVFDDRVRDARIIEGHGDLRAEHVYLDGDVKIIDCVEFSAELRQLDVADELSFLAMECERIGDSRVGDGVLEVYCRTTGDQPDDTLLAFYKSYRACVRAKVAAVRGSQVDASAEQTCEQTMESYLKLADAYAAKLGPPLLLVVRGLMGSGKTTLASALAHELGAEHLQTDVIRTELFGGRTQDAPFGEGRYCQADRRRVYDEMFHQAQSCLADGLSVVLDASFLSSDLRIRAFEIAKHGGATPLIVHCDCPEEIAKQRISLRLASGNSDSEARPDLYRVQRRAEEPQSRGLASVRVDSTIGLEQQVQHVLNRLSFRATEAKATV